MTDDGKDQDLMLPIANVGRLMKQILPEGAKISREAKQTMQESATEFISFVTGEASAKCQNENRRTVNGDDICWALSTLGLDNYVEAIIRYLYKYREAERLKAANAKNNKSFENNHNDNNINHYGSSSTSPVIEDQYHDYHDQYNVQKYNSYGGNGIDEVVGQAYGYMSSSYYTDHEDYSSVRALHGFWEA